MRADFSIAGADDRETVEELSSTPVRQAEE